jgi:ribose/xylose/arabinose/galactoside ABC-type transport system permease subunit
MNGLKNMLADTTLRPFLLLLLVVVGFAAFHGEAGGFLERKTAFSAFQHFATVGLVALALGLTMLMREFDLSVAGMMGLGGCVAVMSGNDYASLGLLVAVLVGAAGGLIQGGLIVRLGLGSVAVSLGGLLTFTGIAYVLTGNQTIAFDQMDVAIAINAPVLGLMSVRALVVLAIFIVAALVITYTRIGRDIIAAGSNRHASVIAGTNPDKLLVGVFTASGALSALAGAMLSYGLSSASPTGGVSDILVPAVAAAILGGVSLSGGVGRPLGIAAGVLILCVLRTGLTSLGVEPYVHEIVTGAILLAVAVADGPHLKVRWFQLSQLARPRRAAPHHGE